MSSARNDGTILAHNHSSSSNSGSRSTSDSIGSAGDAVVVKVLHPRVRDQVSADMDLLGACAWALEHLPLLGLQYLSLRQLVGEFDKVPLDTSTTTTTKTTTIASKDCNQHSYAARLEERRAIPEQLSL